MVPFLSALVIGCGGFLLAILWMDLMFDVQVLPHRHQAELPESVLASIAAYYQRATTGARPMSHAVGLAMLIGIVALIVQLVRGDVPSWLSVVSLLLILPPVALAAGRVVPNAVRLGKRIDPPRVQSELARRICRDHLLCLGAIVAFLALRLVMTS